MSAHTPNTSENLEHLPVSVRLVFAFLANLKHGNLEVLLPDGRSFQFAGKTDGPNGKIQLHDYDVLRATMKRGVVGFCESYIEGHWNSPDVTSLLQLFVANTDMLRNRFLNNPVSRFAARIQHWMNRNSKSGSERNIQAHYDLGNAFYSQWLDETMTYSSALYEDKTMTLSAAQERKYQALCEAIGLEEGMSVLEIGCGWGGFAEYAARTYGCTVKCLTISNEQLAYARERMEKAQLKHLVDIVFQDYRDETGQYDRVVSIEMFEAVGEKYWPTFFNKVNSCLKPNGQAGLQIITIRDDDFVYYRKNPDFIQKYIFPGGMLPPPLKLGELFNTYGFNLAHELRFGGDYATTLKIWRERFWDTWHSIEELGFDERFKRTWELYLHYCEAGFKAGSIDVRQYALIKQ